MGVIHICPRNWREPTSGQVAKGFISCTSLSQRYYVFTAVFNFFRSWTWHIFHKLWKILNEERPWLLESKLSWPVTHQPLCILNNQTFCYVIKPIITTRNFNFSSSIQYYTRIQPSRSENSSHGNSWSQAGLELGKLGLRLKVLQESKLRKSEKKQKSRRKNMY